MLNAVVGSVIMLIATTSLFSAVEVIERAFADAGRQPLALSEERLLQELVLQISGIKSVLARFHSKLATGNPVARMRVMPRHAYHLTGSGMTVLELLVSVNMLLVFAG